MIDWAVTTPMSPFMQPLIYSVICIPSLLLVTSCSSHMMDESKNHDFSELPQSAHPVLARAGLIDVLEVDSSIEVDLQYKRPSTIAKSALYPKSFPALLVPETAVRLRHANTLMKKHGMKIVVWDAYRPPSAQRQLWHASGHNDTFVANPDTSPSRHSCGTAVDVTLLLLDGGAVKMPTGFDAFTPEASSNFMHMDPEIRRNLSLLQSAMTRSGFYPLPSEWWHYIDKNYQKYPDPIPLEKLRGSY